ncbi:gliding motility protein [Streptomyces sp. URMC 123]|uniref:gliding motility protein n=1 Tax=Streptomyces sp. URMC 123 TaxID=3423403 RepID=UPI003F1D6366
MGAFLSKLLRKSSKASTEETATATPTAESKATAETPAEEKAEAAAEPAEAGEAAAEGVDIPKQQSAEEAADSETGEGARK